MKRVTEGILKPLTDICNLSFLSEILETLFNICHDKLTAKHTLHAKSHQGFSSIRTTWTILTEPSRTVGTFKDLRNALDIINHDILGNKLGWYVNTGLDKELFI